MRGPTRRTRLGTICLLAAAWAVATVGHAEAYVRTRTTNTQIPMAWSTSCLNVEFLLGSGPENVSKELFQTAVSEAAAQWSSATAECPKMFITVSPSSATKGYVEADGVNKIQFRTDAWERSVRDPKDVKVYLPNELAITSVFASNKTGEIFDTDIELNAVNAQWGDLVENPQLAKSSNMHDLQNTLTHELGHVIGLDHTCNGGGQSNFFDHESKPVPTCPGSIEMQETTMAAIVMPGDTLRRSLSADDKKGVCDIYPADRKLACSEEGGGCTMAKHSAGRGQGGWFLTAAVAFAAAWLWSRSRRWDFKNRQPRA